MSFLLGLPIFRGYVKFQGCNGKYPAVFFFFRGSPECSGHYGFHRMSTSLHRWRRCFVSWRWVSYEKFGRCPMRSWPRCSFLGEFLGDFLGQHGWHIYPKRKLSKGKRKGHYCCRIPLLRWAEGEFCCKTCSEDSVFNIWIAFAESVLLTYVSLVCKCMRE